MTRKKRDRRTLDHDMDKLRSTIKQFVRDWSEEVRAVLNELLTALFLTTRRCGGQGKPERDSTYTPIVEALKDHFRDIPDERRCEAKWFY